MTVSLDSPLSGGAGEGRQRLQRAAARAVGFYRQNGGAIRSRPSAEELSFCCWWWRFSRRLIAPYNPLVQDLNSALVAPNAQALVRHR
ncbi:Uncharacterised protein [Serratia liquefaciens]|nr:Uncharacterised protein [Serratia liquefaciens]